MCANSKDLANRTVSDNISKDRAYEIALNPKYDEYQRRLASMVHKFFDRKIGSVTKANVNKVLAQELHKPVIAVWPADLAVTRWLSFENRSVKYLLCVIDVFTEYAWVKLLKDKRDKTILHCFIKIVVKSKYKPNKLWVDQGKDFYNSLKQKWLDNNDVLMYSKHNEGKSVVAESAKI